MNAQHPRGARSAPGKAQQHFDLPLRQIHLDFHTPPEVGAIGEKFSGEQFAAVLTAAEVDSINLFAKCHHGYSYHDTEVGERHPGLRYDLLRAQYDACRAAGVGVQIYVSAGWDELQMAKHPEWRKLGPTGEVLTHGGKPFEGGWLEVCFNTGYLDYLCAQIAEVARLFPDCDGFWLDIVHQDPCYCPTCQASMIADGLDPTDPEAAATQMRKTRQLYLAKTTEASRSVREDMPVFHNMGHAPRGDRSVYEYYSHLELESLPTGGWGYDHFPLSAAFAQRLDKSYLGMTGRFNTLWGEFGGVKHTNAMLYECGVIAAYGGRISIGDHLHPSGELDADAYAVIGAAYRDVGRKRVWLGEGAIRSDLAVYSRSAQAHPGLSQGEARHDPIDSAVSRVMLETGLQFHLVDRPEDIFDYPLVVFPDEIVFDAALASAVRDYVKRGGKVLLTGDSGLDPEGRDVLDIGAERQGPSPFSPDFVGRGGAMHHGSGTGPIVVYGGSTRLKVTDGLALADIHDPFLQKHGMVHYGHLHAPPRDEPSGFAAAVEKGGVVTLAHKVFRSYGETGAVSQRDFIESVIDRMLGGARILKTTMPSNGRATVLHQADENREIVHLLFAPLNSRGRFKGKAIEVIEDIPPLFDIAATLAVDTPVASVRLVPEDVPLEFEATSDGISFTVPRVHCHQMIEVAFEAAPGGAE